MNYLDLGVVILLALCALAGYRQGLIRTVYRLASFFIALFLANALYPYVARLLSGSSIYTAIQDSIKTALGLEDFVATQAAATHTEVIESLYFLPAALRDMLNSYFAPNINDIARIDAIENYISAFFADIAINGIAIILVFALVMIILSVAGVLLDIVGKLPVIRTFNNIGGLIAGIIMGAGIAWLCIVLLSIFTAANPSFFDLLEGSFVASRVLENIMQ
jgi:hypothetical protein